MKRIFIISLLIIVLTPLIGWSQNNNIMLITPYNHDTLNTVYPNFSWSYMKQLKPRNHVKYIFTLVKLNNNQTASAGLLTNIPLVHIIGIQGYQFSYPFDAPELTYNNRYGWQIAKEVNGIVVSKSEPWEFILYRSLHLPKKYAVLSLTTNSTIYSVNNKGFFFKFKNRYLGEKGLKFLVLNEKSNKMPVYLGQDKKKIKKQELGKTGKNSYFLKTGMYPPGVYTLIVTDLKGNKYTARFKVKN